MSKRASDGKRKAVSVQVDAMDLVNHGGALHARTHLPKGDSAFAEQIPAPVVKAPETDYAFLQILVKIMEAFNAVEPNSPEAVVLCALAKNYITAEAAAAMSDGTAIAPIKPEEFQSQKFNEAVNALNKRSGGNPAQRDALACVAAAATQSRPLTTRDVAEVCRHLSEGMQLTPAQWQQIVQHIIATANLAKREADEWNKRLQDQSKPSVLDLANVVEEAVSVQPDGTFVRRMEQPAVTKPDEAVALLELTRDFWLALFKAGQESKLPDDGERQMAEVMKNAAAMYVRTGSFSMQTAIPVDAAAQRFLIKKLKAIPMVKADRAKMVALEKLEAAQSAGKPPSNAELIEIFDALGKGVHLKPEVLEPVLEQVAADRKGLTKNPKELAGMAGLLSSGDPISPMEAIRVMTKAEVQKPSEAVALLELTRDFWLAMFKAGQESKLPDDGERQMAEVMKNAAAMYVRTGSFSMQTAIPVDAAAQRFLIKKLKAIPMVKADRAKLVALEKLEAAQSAGKPPSNAELVEIFDALGKGVHLKPEILEPVLEQVAADRKGLTKNPKDLAGMAGLLSSGDSISPMEAIRVINKAEVQKPSETIACLDLYSSLFSALHATKQTASLKDQHQRLTAETLRGAGQLHGPTQTSRMVSGAGGSMIGEPIDVNAHRMTLMKLRAEPQVKADKAKKRAVDELVSAQATGNDPSPEQLLDIFKELGREVKLTPEMMRPILDFMTNAARTLTPNEKAELQKRLKKGTASGAADLVDEATRVKEEISSVVQQAKVVGGVQVFPEGHAGFGAASRPLPPAYSREVGMRSGPASVEWHNYKAMGSQQPATEMARIVLARGQLKGGGKSGRSQLMDGGKFGEFIRVRALVFGELTQKTQTKDAQDVTFRSMLQPSVMKKYEETLKGNKDAMRALQNISKVGTATTDNQLEKNVDELLKALTIDREQLRGVLQQLVRDKLMTNNEAKELERHCDVKMAEGGGKMMLSDLQEMMRRSRGA